MPIARVNDISWSYTIIGTSPNQTASIGTGFGQGNATALGTGLSGAVTIPSPIDSYTVTIISTSSFQNCTNITSVTIPISTLVIGTNCFRGCTKLLTAVLPNGITTINDSAFRDVSLSSVTIPNSVTYLGPGVFLGCKNLRSLTIGTSITTINAGTFQSCSSLTSVNIPNSVTSIGASAFQNCTNLASINIPDSVTSIGADAFSGTSSALTVTMNTGKFGIPSPSTNRTFFGNLNNVDFVLPTPLTMDITANVANNATTNVQPITLTFTSSASTNDFFVGDISVTNGTLSAFTPVSATVYTATFTPIGQGACTINVQADKFTDAVGTLNAASNTFTFTFDSFSPNMFIVSTSGVDNGSITNVKPIELRFTSSEATNNFGEGDISITNGTLSSSFTAISATVYTATFTPTGPGPVACTIDVLAGAYTDAATNLNNLATQFAFTYDSIKPEMEITANVANNATTNNANIELTFTSSKPTSNFVVGGISVNNGSLSTPLTYISDTVYKAIFTPNRQGAYTINVAAGAFTDAAGNGNTASNTFNWTYDSVSPNMSIASTSGVASGSTTNVTPIELSFISTEATNNFGEGGISVTNGTLSNFASSSPTVYTARFTPTGPGPVACTIDVLAGAYTDAATNLNNLATQFTFTFDSVRPTMDISSNVISGSTTNNETIELTFTSTEVTTNFVKENIRVSNGTLSSLTTSDNKVYNATFTRINTITEGQCTIDVDAGAYTDAAGNNNIAATTFIWNFETVSPNMTITASVGPSNIDIATGATTNYASILLIFTSSESTTNFEYVDISVTNGTLGTLTTSDNMVYYATFTPDENGATGKTECSISVPADKFTDAVGNYNIVSNTFTFTFDNTKPTIEITSTTVTSGSTTNNSSIELTFTLSEVPTGFEYSDISVTNGVLGSLTTQNNDNKVYYATFTPNESDESGKTECSISVPEVKFTDAVGNSNTASNTFTFTFDNTKPTIDITSTTVTSGSTTNNSSIELIFTLSEVPTGFEYADISVTGGTISPLDGSGTVYTAIFTPDENGVSGKTECSISVPADKFIDAVGNDNTAAPAFNFTFDNTKPGMMITATYGGSSVTSGSTTKNKPIELTFTLSEVPTGFEYADISVTGGTLSPLDGGGTVYTAIFTPDENGVSGKTECSISVPADKFIDAVGNDNTAAPAFNFTFDNTKPGMMITATYGGSSVTSGSTTKNKPIELTFTLTEVPTGFEYADISVTNGALGTLTTSDNMVYYATFTPDENGVTGKTECSISVPADKFTDAVGNSNTASTPFTFTFDSVPPTMDISSNITSGSITNISPIELTFTSSEPITGFTRDDISFNKGTLSDPLNTISDTVYKAIFTPDEQGAYTIYVPAGSFIDVAGNSNTAATQFTFTFDSVRPTMDISSNVTSGLTTNNETIELTFTSSEATTNFVKENIRVSNGTLSSLTTSDNKVYNATFTRINTITEGQCTIDVDAGAYTDAAGNNNIAASTFIWNFETVSPNITITATAGPSNIEIATGSTTNNETIELTFTSSEATTNFVKENIRVSNGTLSSLTTSDNKVYNATFTRINTITEGQCTIDVDAGAYTDAAGNNNIAASTFIWNFETVSPNMTITATAGPSNIDIATGATTNTETIELTFTSSEATTNFVKENIRVSNGTLSSLTTSDNKVYNATFTRINTITEGQCTIDVDAGAYTDAAGNNNIAASTFIWNFETVSPNITITATAGPSNVAIASGATTNHTPILLTFSLSEVPTGFEYADISVTNGTLGTLTTSDNMVYYATFTPDENGLTGVTECSISVPADKFTDYVGNYNTASNIFNFTFDNTEPGMMITASASGFVVTSGSTTKNTPIELTFTTSEAITGFEYADISFTGGTLSPLDGGGSVYTATFTPDESDESGKTECSISVPEVKFIDAVGNSNTASNTFTFTFDNTKPTIEIASTTVTSGSTTKNTPIELTFTLSEVPTGFEYADISVIGGTLSPLDGSGTVYTAIFTPDENDESGKTECSISVPEVKFIDAVGNSNTASNTFTFTFDNTKPTIEIASTTVTSGSTTKNKPIELTFTLSEVPTGFEYADISVNGGTLSPLDGSDTVYTATFTPDENGVSGKTECSISVPADKFTDAVGNSNTASNTFNFTFDNTKPTITIESTTVTSGSTTKNTPIELTFTLSEVPTGFEYSDIIVTNGALGNLTTSDNMVYYATFTPDENDESGKTECSISVPEVKFVDAVGNYNTASNTFAFTFDKTKPTMTITASASGLPLANNATTNNASIDLTFTSTEATTNFIDTDISVTNGTLTNFAGIGTDGYVYTATFTPQNPGACTINVAEGAYTDAVGNSNNAATTFNWTFDNISPRMTITSTTDGVISGSTINNETIALTFTSTKATNNFEEGDIDVTNGALSNFLASSATVYTATFTSHNQGVCTIDVAAGAFTDAVGNSNTAATRFNWTLDSVPPDMTITSTTDGVTSGSTTNNASIALTFTSTEATTNFAVGDITVTNGALTNFAGIGTDGDVYTAIFTPHGQGACTIDVLAGAYTDAATNLNNVATQFTWTFDSVQPDITITSATVTSGSITDDATIELIFTSTKATNNFVVGDISLTNGALTNFAGIGTDGAVYTATFTPTGTGACTIDVAAGAYTDAAGNTNTAATRFNWTFARNVSFDTNTLTIVNSISANVTDTVLFVLPYGEEMSSINVTAFTGTGTITYDLSTDGESVRRGTFRGRGTNLLGTNPLITSTNTTFTGRGTNLRGTNVLIEPTNTTYILTLSANTSISYTIVGTKIVNYGNVPPTALSFVNNKLTIQNNIDSADVDRVSFDINAGSLFDSLVVISLLNRNRISYVLDISGGPTVSSGSFIQADFNLLTRELPEQSTNTTYILTLTCVGTNTYSIVGRSRNDQRFDIDKFCSRQGIPCNNVGYNRLVTSTNNPSVSNKMRYSQLLRSRRFKPIQKIGTSVPPPKPEIPLYLFATGQIFAQSVFR